MMAALTDGQDYIFATQVIDRLSTNAQLSTVLINEPFDREDQIQGIALSIGQYSAAIAVMPQPPSPAYADGDSRSGAGLIIVSVAILIMMTAQLSGKPTVRRLSAMTGEALRMLHDWTPRNPDIAAQYPWIAGIEELSTSDVPELRNVCGRLIRLSMRVHV